MLASRWGNQLENRLSAIRRMLMWSLGLNDVKSRVLDDLEKRVNRGRGASVSPRDKVDHIESGQEENCNNPKQWWASLPSWGTFHFFHHNVSPVSAGHFPSKLNVVEHLWGKEFHLLKQWKPIVAMFLGLFLKLTWKFPDWESAVAKRRWTSAFLEKREKPAQLHGHHETS